MPNRPPFRRRRLGKKLARMRGRAGMTLEAAAEALYKTRSALHRIEKGDTLVDVHLVKSMMDLYDAYDEEIIEQTKRARERGWWTSYGIENQGYIDVETEASRIDELAPLIIPGLLQTPDYMRALFEAHRLRRTKRWLDNDIKVRQIRQQRLTDPDNPLQLDTIIDEAALRRIVGSREVVREQLAHLLEMARLSNVTLRVLGYEQGAHQGMLGGFTLLHFPEPEELPVLFIEHMVGALHIEDSQQLSEAKLVFKHLADQALSPEQSLALIERMSAE